MGLHRHPITLRLVLFVLLQDGVKLVNCSVMGENLRANSNIDHGAKEKDYLRLRLSRPKCKSVMMIREKKRPDYSQKKEGIMSGFELVTCAFGS